MTHVSTRADWTPVLDDLAADTRRTLARLGDPTTDLAVVATDRAYALAKDRAGDGVVVQVYVGVERGTEYAMEGVAGYLAGMDACSPADINSPAANWSVGLARWLAYPDETDQLLAESAGDSVLFEDALLAQAGEQAAQEWYRAHRDALTTCSYSDSGP